MVKTRCGQQIKFSVQFTTVLCSKKARPRSKNYSRFQAIKQPFTHCQVQHEGKHWSISDIGRANLSNFFPTQSHFWILPKKSWKKTHNLWQHLPFWVKDNCFRSHHQWVCLAPQQDFNIWRKQWSEELNMYLSTFMICLSTGYSQRLFLSKSLNDYTKSTLN